MSLNNQPVVPIFAVPLSDAFFSFGINEEVEIQIEAEDGHTAFVSGVAGSYSLAPTGSADEGTLVVGRFYTIQTYVAGDDFANVGGANVTGSVFRAIAAEPTDWTNGSTLTWLGNLQIATSADAGGQIDLDLDIDQSGHFEIYFQRAAVLRSGETIYFRLAAGGAGVVGKLNLLGVGGVLAAP